MSSPDRRADWLPAAAAVRYLNTGSAGPLLTVAADAIAAAIDHELRAGRAAASAWQEFLDSRHRLRTALAALLGGGAHEVAFTHNTTEGLNIALWGLPWRGGERLLITSLEHDAGIAAAAAVARRYSLQLDVIDVRYGETEETLAALDRALQRPATALLTSHVAWSTGAVLPIAQMTPLAHAHGCAVIVDGAQAVGALNVDVHALDVDAYAFNGYKFLLGPEGTGGLFVAERWHDRMTVTFGGAFGADPTTIDASRPLTLKPAEGAARYESGSLSRPLLAGLLATAEHHRVDASATDRIAATVQYAAARLDELGAVIHTPPSRAGLLSFSVQGLDARAAVAELEGVGVIVRNIPQTNWLRISCAAFVTAEDIDALVTALAALIPKTVSSLT